jgi:hypothetical protein
VLIHAWVATAPASALAHSVSPLMATNLDWTATPYMRPWRSSATMEEVMPGFSTHPTEIGKTRSPAPWRLPFVRANNQRAPAAALDGVMSMAIPLMWFGLIKCD